MECRTDSQNVCENCVLCAASGRVHSWRNSGRTFLNTIREKGRTGANYVIQEISERSRRFEEAHPKTSEFLGSTRRKIVNVGVIVVEKSKNVYFRGVLCVKDVYTFTRTVAAIPPLERARRFFVQNTIGCYFCVGLILIGLTFPILALTASSYPLLCNLWLIFVAVVAVWVPIYYWWQPLRRENELNNQRRQVQLMDKPPLYESLIPASHLPLESSEEQAPPTYEELYADNQGLLDNSSCGFGSDPPCAVHNMTVNFSTIDAQNADAAAVPTTSQSVHEPNSICCVTTEVHRPIMSENNFSVQQKSRSMSDLHSLRLESSYA